MCDPAGWTFAEEDNPQATLERMTVRRLTALFRSLHVSPPSCEEVWQAKFGPIDFNLVWAQFTPPLITPRDFKSAFRIAHRSLFLRAFNPNAPSQVCRLCCVECEHFSHLARCEHITHTFDLFIKFAQNYDSTLQNSEMLIYLGMRDGATPLKGAISALRIIVWKFALIAFVRVDTDGVKYSATDVWRAALRRFASRIDRYDIYVARLTRRNKGFGNPPRVEYHTRILAPLEGYDPLTGSPVPRPHLADSLRQVSDA